MIILDTHDWGNPADRLIIATALEHQAQLASLDQHFPAYVELAEHLIQE